MEELLRDETSFDDSDLLEPFSFYNLKLKDAFHDNAEDLFQKLTKKADTDIETNRAETKKYESECSTINKLEKNVSSKKGLRGLLIFLIVLCAIAIVTILVMTFVTNYIPLAVSIAVPIGCAGAITGSIFGIIKLNKIIKGLNEELTKHRKIAAEHKEICDQTMASLNALFESNMAAHLMSKTTPVVDLDRDFDPEKYSYLHDKYGYETSNENNVSTLFAQSGHILGNPFVIEKTYHQSMRDHTYTGSITITWTERVSNGKGGYTTVLRSQVLTASVTKPEPAYHISTRLIYGNMAAPNLSFSRSPTGHGNDDEKQLERYVNNFDKKLDKMVEEDLKDDRTSFTRLHNSEFEALFNALNRDNETEFRLLFTPLAQKNMIALIQNKEHVGYGDDFSFTKRKTLNFITAGHLSSSTNLDKNADSLRHYSYDRCHENFVRYCDEYCREIYFALAPLISIPLYQQHKTLDYIYNGGFGHNVTQAEAEAAANTHSWNLFKHPATRSLGVILKSRFIQKNDTVDECMITAHSFSGTDRVTYISKLGGDGRWHDVPVHWVEYNPISKDTPFAIGRAKEDNFPDFNNNYNSGTYNELLKKYMMGDRVLYKKGLFSFVKKD